MSVAHKMSSVADDVYLLLSGDKKLADVLSRVLPGSLKLAPVSDVEGAKRLIEAIPNIPLFVEFPRGEEIDKSLEFLLTGEVAKKAVILSSASDVENIRFLHLHPEVNHILSTKAAGFERVLRETVAKHFGQRDMWGIEQMLQDPIHHHKEQVSSYGGQNYLKSLDQYISGLKCFRGFGDMVQTVISELLMNAVIDAHPDDEVKDKRRVLQRKNEKFELTGVEEVFVEYGHDKERFALSITDGFGGVNKNRIVRSLLRASMAGHDQIRLSEGRGAGVGLWVVYSSCSELTFNVKPGKKTEVIYSVVLSKRQKSISINPKAFNFFTEGK